ncbi:TPR repeat-containing protein [Zancudomyces culisetae]|uniref:TPR repeat-containing protein n=1 Tax=Zancudomyces culisetae TaxID=1213189 RepID=A0A1R1PV66_ZANCU|nr:TPR repeat-containing protein [Zancudomyces culisetae]|eukprot:OMH84865.1 TPR repeat-containing protein [Zancudomyces culisetae]
MGFEVELAVAIGQTKQDIQNLFSNESAIETECLFETLQSKGVEEVLKSSESRELLGCDEVADFKLDFTETQKSDNVLKQYIEYLDFRIERTLSKYGNTGGWNRIVAIGVACLNAFVQANFTGPELTFESSSLLPKGLIEASNPKGQEGNLQSNPDSMDVEKSNKAVEITGLEKLNLFLINILGVSGEMVYGKMKEPLLLFLSLYLLVKTVKEDENVHEKANEEKSKDGYQSLLVEQWIDQDIDVNRYKQRNQAVLTSIWWMTRSIRVLQSVLDERVGKLMDVTEKYYDLLEGYLFSAEAISNSGLECYEKLLNKAKAYYSLERALLYQYYGKNKQASEWLRKSQAESGLKWKITGIKGKRTKFQEFSISQLVVLAKSSNDDDLLAKKTDKPKVVPTLPLNDDTLLEQIEFEVPDNRKASVIDENSAADMDADDTDLDESTASKDNIKVLDQCILLAFCLEVRNENPDHGITIEQMTPFVTRVLENPNNWTVHSAALLQRSRLESKNSRKVERSVLQLQALADQMDTFNTGDADASERLAYFYAVSVPSSWRIKKELANAMASVGAIRTALEIYTKLELWDEMISCYQLLEQPEVAERLVRDRLESFPTDPKLWCILGDLKQDPSQWEKAWEVSGNRFTRAMRSLGGYYFKAGKMQDCINSYKLALKLNPLFEGSWYTMGCAALQMEDWEQAVQAFQHVVQLDYENAEAWNNLASVYLKTQDKKFEAWNCLREALKFKYDSWQIWYNFLVTSISIGRFASALQAMQRIIDLRVEIDGANCIDIEMLDIIIAAVTQQHPLVSNTSPTHERIEKRTFYLSTAIEHLLVNTIATRITDSPKLWRIIADFWLWKSDYKSCLDCYEKAYRCIVIRPEVAHSSDVFDEAVTYLMLLVDMYKTLGPKSILLSLDSIPESASEHVPKSRATSSLVCPNYKSKAMMAVKGLVARGKSNFEDTQNYNKLEQILEEIGSW